MSERIKADSAQPADSGRVGDGVMTALAVIYGSGYRHGHEATVEGGYTDVVHYDRETYWLDTVREMVDEDADLAAALAAQGLGQGEAAAWMAEDDAALSARTSGRMGGINDGTRFISFKELKQGDYRHVFPLYTAPPASPARVPDGWRLVPVESTSEMDIAGADIAKLRGAELFGRNDAKRVWSVMLAAAPSAPESNT